MAREFDRSQISTVIPVNGEAPKTEPYQRLLAGRFADWRLTIDGLVDRPGSFSLADLKRFPSRSQITHQACEEGWSFIAEWTGAPLLSCSNVWESVAKPSMSSSSPSMTGGTASTWTMRCIHRRCSPTP